LVPNNVFTAKVGDEKVAAIDGAEDDGNGGQGAGDVDATKTNQDNVTELKPKDSVENCDEERKKEEDENLPEECAV